MEYSNLSSGVCGSCPTCLDNYNFKLNRNHFKLMLWSERDNLQFYLVDKATEQYSLLTYNEQEAFDFLQDNDIFLDILGYKNPKFQKKLFDALWSEAKNQDSIEDVPSYVIQAAFEEDITSGKIADEGAISSQGCDLCGSWEQQTLYDAHGTMDDQLVHLNICDDCLLKIN